jgi:hypothetical protein
MHVSLRGIVGWIMITMASHARVYVAEANLGGFDCCMVLGSGEGLISPNTRGQNVKCVKNLNDQNEEEQELN